MAQYIRPILAGVAAIALSAQMGCSYVWTNFEFSPLAAPKTRVIEATKPALTRDPVRNRNLEFELDNPIDVTDLDSISPRQLRIDIEYGIEKLKELSLD